MAVSCFVSPFPGHRWERNRGNGRPPEHASARSSMAGVVLVSPFPATAGNATAETVAPSEHAFASSLFVGRDFGIRGFPQDRGPVTSSFCECGAAVATASGARPLGAIDAPLGEQPLKRRPQLILPPALAPEPGGQFPCRRPDLGTELEQLQQHPGLFDR